MTPEEQKVIEDVISDLDDKIYLLRQHTTEISLDDLVFKLRALLPPEPERIGGLTIPEWQQLAELGDVLVGVSQGGKEWSVRYLKRIDASTGPQFISYVDGRTSVTNNCNRELVWPHCRLIEDDRWRLNEGKQPVPNDVKLEIMERSGKKHIGLAMNYDWRLTGSDWNIIAYRIIGVSDE